MERSARTQRTLSKQAEFDEDTEIESTLSNRSLETEPANEDVPPPVPVNNNTVHRARSQSKVKLLVRSHAVREETSPPPDPPETPEPMNTSAPTSPANNNNNNNNVSSSNNNINSNSNNTNNHNGNGTPVSNGTSLSVTGTRHKLRREGSSQGSMDSSWSGCLSRGSSMEQQYTDGTGVDLEQFIADTLNRNQKDRMLLLKIEHELVSLAKDTKRSVHKFPPMSSYQRMLVHRVAAYFGMDHNVDTSGHQVVVNRTKATRIPDARFCEHVRDDLLFPEEPRRSILKRDSSSFEETCCFKEGNQDCSQHNSQDEDDLRWSVDVQPWNCTESENPPHSHSKSQTHCHERPNRLLKVESYESKDTLRANSLRLSVSKSYSFGGYDQQNASNSGVLTKQDSGSSMSSRLSPSSSGYKSQSQRSDTTISATPSPTATPHLANQLSSQSSALSPEPESAPTVVWAVTSIAAVPPGSVLINPQTGQPYTNSDGSIYHFDPENPPKMESAGEVQPVPQPAAAKSSYQNETGTETLCNGESSDAMDEDKSPEKSLPPLAAATVTTTTTTITTTTTSTITTTTATATSTTTFSGVAENRLHASNHFAPASQSSPQTATCCSQTNLPDSVQSHSGHLSLQPPAHAPPPPVLYPVSPHPPIPPAQYPPPNPSYPQPALCPYTPGSYNLVLQPPPPQPPPPPPIPMPTGESVFPPGTPVTGTAHPLVYASVPPANHGYTPVPSGSVQPSYEQRLPIPDGSGTTHDLNGYMMGLNVGDSNRHGISPAAVYWPPATAPIPTHPPAHIAQGQSQSVPIYYAPPQPAGHNAAPRYQHTGCSTYSALPSVDRSGSGYGGSDCSLNYPQPVPMYYSPHCNSNQNPIPTGTSGYCGGGSSGVVVQFPPNTVHGPQHPPQPYHKVPTPPNTPQGLCPQYTVFSNGYGIGGMPGCYPSHYPSSANPPPHHQLPMPPTLRPPNLNLPMAVRSSPPLRSRGPGYGGTRSPALKERSPAIYPVESNKPSHHTAGSIRFTTAPTHAHMPPFYGIPVMPGDVRLMGNNNRLPLPLPANCNKPLTSHTRKQRTKPAPVVANRSGVRPVIGIPNQHQPLGIPTCYMNMIAP